METKKMTKNDKKYFCNSCDFNTCKKTNYEIHLQTQKHKVNKMETFGNNMETEKNFNCENCNKFYNTRTGLWKHKKKCINIENIKNEKNEKNENNENNLNYDDPSDKQLIMMLIKENSDFKNLMLQTFKNGTCNTTNNNINNNSHNKTFNLQFFLNETCKDAMNIMDFVDSIKLQLSDLENVGKLGYVEGISNIIIKNLNDLDVEKRPVHCTDSKREVLYVKDENQWYKEENENKKIKKAIKHITHKNTKMLPEFKAKYPDCVYSDSKKSDQYNKIIIESLNDSNENENKIIKKIAKKVIVDK